MLAAVLFLLVTMYQTVLAMEPVWISMYANVIRDGLEAIVLNTLANDWIIALVSYLGKSFS